jgi:signal transduction histidine kinase
VTRRSRRSQLVAELVLVASAAVVLVGIITALVAGANVASLALPLTAFWAGSTAVLLVFGLHLLRRQVLRPLDALAAEADALRHPRESGGPSSGGLGNMDSRVRGNDNGRGNDYETREFQALAERFRAMAGGLLNAQGQVVRSEKLAGIGRLAAGVAHEVRNPLGAIGTWIEVLRQRGTEPAVLDDMRTAVDRIERIVASLLDYARPAPATERSDLSRVARRASSFLGAQGALREVQFELVVDETVPLVLGDAHALEQVVINLVLNARDSAARKIVVSVQPHSLKAGMRPSARLHDDGQVFHLRPLTPRPVRPDLPSGAQGVLLIVADDGPGIADENRERVFDPFYTTRDPGKGTGLGLAIVARTVHEAGGMVWVDRAREGGAAFKVFLPSRDTEWERCAS